MAKSASADRYVVTVPVVTTLVERHQLDRKFEAARQQHNAVLGQLLRRHRAARRDRRWQTAASTRDATERRRLYDAVCADVGLSERALARSMRSSSGLSRAVTQQSAAREGGEKCAVPERRTQR